MYTLLTMLSCILYVVCMYGVCMYVCMYNIIQTRIHVYIPKNHIRPIFDAEHDADSERCCKLTCVNTKMKLGQLDPFFMGKTMLTELRAVS